MSESKKEVRAMRAAALKYNKAKDQAPIVVAAGGGFVAQKICEIADECGLAIYHDDSAATLLSQLKLGQEIPSELYEMVVDIYMTILAAADSAKPALTVPADPEEDVPVENAPAGQATIHTQASGDRPR